MRRKFDRDFRAGAVRIVRETGRPIAQVAKDLGINEGTLGNCVKADREARRPATDSCLHRSVRSLVDFAARTPSWQWNGLSLASF